MFGFLESVAEVAAKLKEPKIANRRCEDVVVDVEKAAVLMWGLDQAAGCPVFRGTFAGHAKFFVRNRAGLLLTYQTVNASEQQARFEEWVKTHGAILHHVTNGFAEGDDRNDLMQELLLAVWRAIPAFRHGAQPSTFIYRVSHNAALTWKRTLRNYRNRVERFQEQPAFDASTPADSPEPALLERLYAEIRKLPPLDRSLMLLSLDGVSYADMAQIHGLSESNVGVRLNRAKQQLAKAMKGAANEL